MVTADPQRKRPFDIYAYPIDFSQWLPGGLLLGSASGSAVEKQTGAPASIIAAAAIRPGGLFVDVVLTGGAKGVVYIVSLQALVDAPPSAVRPQLQLDFEVTVV